MRQDGHRDPVFDWCHDGLYQGLRGIDLAGLMWEWLRRDRDYVAWHTAAGAATRTTGMPAR